MEGAGDGRFCGNHVPAVVVRWGGGGGGIQRAWGAGHAGLY
jgi:hypothetical protein